MRWEIKNTSLVGPIEFGMTLEKVISVLGEYNDSFKRTLDSKDIIYAYDDIGIHVVCDCEGVLSQLTLFPKNEVFIGKMQLIGNSIDVIYSKLLDIGIAAKRDDIGIWCEDQKFFLVEVDGIVDGVEIFRN